MTYIIIPAKPFHLAKSRLSDVLSPSERVNLSRYLLQRTIQVAKQVGEVVVISREARIRQLAKQTGAWALVESNASLNQAVKQAVDWVTWQDGAQCLILPGDLPLVTPTDLLELTDLETHPPSIVISPCRRQNGTNALLVQPPHLIDFAFGVNSFTKHQNLARQQQMETVVHYSPNLALDLDVPEDLVLWREIAAVSYKEQLDLSP